MTSGSDGKLWRMYDAAAAVANSAKRVTGCVSGGAGGARARALPPAGAGTAQRAATARVAGGTPRTGAPPTWIVVCLRAGAGPRGAAGRVRGY